MDYREVTIFTKDEARQEMLIALLSEMNYDGFEERKDCLIAYTTESDFDVNRLAEILATWKIEWNSRQVARENWNRQWEEHFQPVVLEHFCTIRADFHHFPVETPHEIVITPKMSFGTGHHQTTRSMMRAMKDLDCKEKRVLDFGTGTGILAILAEQLGAASVLAVDNDEWCIENSTENAARNACRSLEFRLGSLEVVQEDCFDLILANINRHILLQYMSLMYDKLLNGGTLLLSGLLFSDEEIVKSAALQQGFRFIRKYNEDNWIALSFEK